jgi:hypothetical protein
MAIYSCFVCLICLILMDLTLSMAERDGLEPPDLDARRHGLEESVGQDRMSRILLPPPVINPDSDHRDQGTVVAEL